MSQETFEHNAMSAVHASRCLTGALLTVYAHLDLLEATDTVLRDAKGEDDAWRMEEDHGVRR